MEAYLLFGIIFLLLILIVLCITILIKNNRKDDRDELDRVSRNITASINENLRNLDEAQTRAMRNALSDVSEKLEKVNQTTETRLVRLQESNEKKLSEIQGVVDEKLQKTLEEKVQKAFQTINEQLSSVNKSMGEMQELATNVGDLKKALTNVKTRGVMGEVQLEKILEQTLSGKYEKQLKIKNGSNELVDFAIKIPSKDEDNKYVLLPIDAKFPMDRYTELFDAYDSGDDCRKKSADTAFERFIKDSAKSICEKYIDVPQTTAFAIMFLPTEGLFAEVVKREALVDELSQKYNITVAGPTTITAFLNSLQMGFQTLTIEKYSANIAKTLSSVKSEFIKFSDALEKVKKKYHGADEELDRLIGTRTNMIIRSLRDVEADSESESLTDGDIDDIS
ncbi:MAG: DNA recombination protein RmuC [Clostridiales bacterium]|nr:MAG: DNA recombination protein RmuC [Clostridiales bacterium]